MAGEEILQGRYESSSRSTAPPWQENGSVNYPRLRLHRAL